MTEWTSTKARVVLRAPLRQGWSIVSQKGSHIKLHHPERGNYMFGFHDREEIGPRMLAKITKHAGLKPEDL